MTNATGTAKESIPDILSRLATSCGEDFLVVDVTPVHIGYWVEIIKEVRKNTAISVAILAADLSSWDWQEIDKMNTEVVNSGGILENVAGSSIIAIADRLRSEAPLESQCDLPFEASSAEIRASWGIFNNSSVSKEQFQTLTGRRNKSDSGSTAS